MSEEKYNSSYSAKHKPESLFAQTLRDGVEGTTKDNDIVIKSVAEHLFGNNYGAQDPISTSHNPGHAKDKKIIGSS